VTKSELIKILEKVNDDADIFVDIGSYRAPSEEGSISADVDIQDYDERFICLTPVFPFWICGGYNEDGSIKKNIIKDC
jgi:hypothetical protein